MKKAKRKTKAEELQETVAEAVGAGKELHLESVDFSDPNRPKTCLEVDFPILPINHVSTIEGNAGKPIYQMSKWWARRRSSVFRSMLIAAATKAPDDPAEAAKLVWDSYYGNHQKNDAFSKLKVADIFMGGGTTIVEGARLGMQMFGNDLNPVAWLVVKNELAQVDPAEVQQLLDDIEAEVKPQIMPFYACDCPRGHTGQWTQKSTGTVMDKDFDPLSLTTNERPDYEYEGPEVIYTFWAKHGPCQATECNHRTPMMSTPVIAVKTLTVKAWESKTCTSCGEAFDVEQNEARMAPEAMLVLAQTEPSYAVMDGEGQYVCPHCGCEYQDQKAANDGNSASLGKAKNKKVDFTLLVHPDWLKGSPATDADGNSFGGSVTDIPNATAAWNEERGKTLGLIEVRGELSESIICPYTGRELRTGKAGGTIPKKSHFACSACGGVHDVLEAIGRSGKNGPVSIYAIQGFCPICKEDKQPYGGRFFQLPETSSTNKSDLEWANRSTSDLSGYWPQASLPFGFKTTYQRIPEHGYPRFVDMFNSRQLLVLTQLLKALLKTGDFDWQTREYVLGAFQQYIRNQNMFCIWNTFADKMEPMFSNNYYHPKNTVIENAVFSKLGRSNWQSCSSIALKCTDWKSRPWETVAKAGLAHDAPEIAESIKGKSFKVPTGDPVLPCNLLTCGSSTDLQEFHDGTLDLVITDPPFGNNIQYAELADLFYVWLKNALGETYKWFASETSPKTVEAVVNPVRNPENPEGFYQRLLTECWKEAFRILKPSGILSFTFHHSEDEPWVALLESLFDAGFYLEATYPIRSDETKGEGAKPGTFGSQLIEYDIVHVCRKRLKEAEPISWARLRRQIMKDVRQLQEVIEHHQEEGLGEADLQVIRRGKALEYYSRHYGKVYIEKGREVEFTVKDALVGINQLLDDESDTTTEAPPVLAEPYTRQFLRLFANKSSLERDQLQKYLRGTGVSPSEFLDRGWCTETKKVFTVTPPLEWAQEWKGVNRKAMSRDFDQSYFLVGACYDDSGIKVSDTLNSPKFGHHPAILDLLDWFGKHGSDAEMRSAAKRAKQLYSSWVAKNTDAVPVQRTMFDLDEDS